MEDAVSETEGLSDNDWEGELDDVREGVSEFEVHGVDVLDKEKEALLLFNAEIDSRGLTDDEAVELALFVGVIDLRDDAVLLPDRDGEGEDEGLIVCVGDGKEVRVTDTDAEVERLSSMVEDDSADLEGEGLERGDRDGDILADVLRDVCGENVGVTEANRLLLAIFDSVLHADDEGLAVKVLYIVLDNDGIAERVIVDVGVDVLLLSGENENEGEDVVERLDRAVREPDGEFDELRDIFDADIIDEIEGLAVILKQAVLDNDTFVEGEAVSDRDVKELSVSV